MEKKFTSVSLPKQLVDKIKDFIKDTGFTSVSSFVEYIMREIISEKQSVKNKKVSKKEVEDIEDKLRNLGYL